MSLTKYTYTSFEAIVDPGLILSQINSSSKGCASYFYEMKTKAYFKVFVTIIRNKNA